ncbi:DUF7507 domain-containing protein, partial [Geoalkalibacter sp.]|uniref:DUF7507 domain-containing protein n=1 Tax=Geoalkalibacter sp. TaxID=3041440 RepID=UPI00272EAD90
PTGPIVAVGSPISWTYVVTNTGNVDLINVMVTDDQGVAVTCPKTTLVVGESMTCTANGLAMEGQYANIGTATGYYNDMPVSDTDPSHYYGAAAAIDIEKYTNGEDADMPTGPIVAVGSPISWTYVVTNTGNVPLTNVKVTDNKIGAIMCPQTTLAVGEVMTCTAEGIAMAGQYANIGTATGDHGDMAVTDNDPSHYYGKMPKIDLEKYVSKDGMNWDDADMPKGLIVPVCPDYTQPGGENDCQTKKDHYRSEHDRTKSEYEKKKNDYERSKSDRDKSKSDYDKSCYEKESSKKNHDNKKSSYDKAKSDYERSKTAANKYRMDKAKSEYDYSKSDYDKKSTSCDSKKADYDRKKYDSDQKKSERDKAKSDYDKAKSDWDKYKDKDCGSDYTDKCGTYECESAVYFRFVVTNNGPVTLTELELTDSDYDTGSCVIPESLAPGQSFECIIGPIPAVAGQHTNTGTATGQYGGIYVMDTDDANYFGVVGKGTGTPGYWMNHPEAWPVESITIGGKTYTKSKAISLMKAPSKGGDKLYTMFQALVAAKLNVLSGNVSDCIDATIAAADQWMATYGPIEVKTVSASSTAWKMGEPLYLLLDDYNNGLLCAPSRDCFDKKDVYRSKGTKTTSFWKAKDKSWPTSSVRVGGKTYYKSEALNYLNSSTKKDVTYKMFHALASAKLNMAEGNEKSCIEDRIKSADSWMEKYGPVGRNLAMTTSAWREGEVHFQILDDYNNGKLCSGYSKDVTSTWSR